MINSVSTDEGMKWAEPAYVGASAAVALFLITLVSLYAFRWRFKSIPILQVLAVLLVNEVIESLFEMMSYINTKNNALCGTSLIGRVAFTVAANFWIIFITRLIYREALAPGKYLNLVHFVFRNMVLAYIPSLILSIFLFTIIMIGDTASEASCWTIITDTNILDYVVYASSFCLPGLVTSIILLVYLLKYKKLTHGKWTIFLLFPIVALFFSAYYIAIKVYLFWQKNTRVEEYEIPFLIEPVTYGCIFLYIYKKQVRRSLHSSSITLDGSDL